MPALAGIKFGFFDVLRSLAMSAPALAHISARLLSAPVSRPVEPRERQTMSLSDKEQWARVQARLRATVGEDIFMNWFAAMELDAIEDDVVRLSVPTRFLKSWVQSHYAEKLLACWQAEQPSHPPDRVMVRSLGGAARMQAVKETPAAPPRGAREQGQRRELRTASAPIAAAHEALGGSPLDPRLTFETFLVGRSNTLAHAAAKQVAVARRGDAVMFNPLYIHAGVGLGKTHLLQSIAWAGNGSAERKVLYLTAEKFMYGFVSALQTQNAIAFKEALRAIDVLVIDDLQFLQGKSTQAEFCHTLNALIDAGRQVVIAADRPPSDLESLDERVRSRLAGGLVVEMGSLGEELRLEILKNRAAAARRIIRASTCRRRCSPSSPRPSPTTAATSKARSTACSPTAS